MNFKLRGSTETIDKKELVEIGIYFLAVLIVFFAYCVASNDLARVGKRTTGATLGTDAVREQLAAIKDPEVPLEVYLKPVDLFTSHGRISEAQTLLQKRLKHIRAQKSKNTSIEQIVLLRRMASTKVKAMQFEDAQLILKEAAKIAEASGEFEQQILISTELIDIYTQYAKFASSQLQRKGSEKLFNQESEHLNKLAESSKPDAKTARLIRNRHRIGLIEMKRFLELDTIDIEP